MVLFLDDAVVDDIVDDVVLLLSPRWKDAEVPSNCTADRGDCAEREDLRCTGRGGVVGSDSSSFSSTCPVLKGLGVLKGLEHMVIDLTVCYARIVSCCLLSATCCYYTDTDSVSEELSPIMRRLPGQYYGRSESIAVAAQLLISPFFFLAWFDLEAEFRFRNSHRNL